MEQRVEGASHGSTDGDLEVTRAPNIFERVKEEFEAIQQTLHERDDSEHSVHCGSDQNHKEDLDVGDVRAPNIFERAKEEIEAIRQSLHEKHGKKDRIPLENCEGNANIGCWTYIGKTMERFCGGSRT